MEFLTDTYELPKPYKYKVNKKLVKSIGYDAIQAAVVRLFNSNDYSVFPQWHCDPKTEKITCRDKNKKIAFEKILKKAFQLLDVSDLINNTEVSNFDFLRIRDSRLTELICRVHMIES